ncbi:glycoside hydrolase superfamily [Chaetomium strumarium]|uniref:chitinase n=1 Tax=Chaetomium strumarium TaxID=1170767 RepID=A0AAJ0LZT5_9PEZI|nr:glycoside hydrolase superfamily [Chaetomium strumarium]
MGQACSYTQVAAGDGCWSLAQRCGITQDQFVQYNGADICSKLQPRQYVCCSEGVLPDLPLPSKLMVGNNICLSTGSPPMPAPLDKASCGPQVPGTPRPANMDDLANLNPCPLNACCNVWGQCSIDENFCIPSPVPGGAPGTATPGSNECIANCGLDIIGNDSPPAEYKRIGYWEGWNADRPCLNMRAGNIDTKRYTHIHFAFGNKTADYHVDVSGLQSAYNDFKALAGVKRIMSFGGWTFSTDYDTYPIFREGVTPEQRYAFAQNVVNFIVNEGLDGVDFDWEYPGAPDIPDIPPASKQNGENYLDFLRNVRQLLPSHLTIGIAAPASFWYLKGFPLAEIAKVVDYIVYMTYDLHGQWDYDNQWTSPGCPKGDCLRSHVNRTETELALVMATKAGAPAHKIIVGMPMYDRSFKMAQPDCWGPDCHFTGPESGAAKGRCTGTSGYISNFEIREIIATNPNIEMHTDDNGDILVYNGDQWVSWLSKSSYEARENWIKGLNFGGASN